MSTVITLAYTTSGLALKAGVFDATGQMWHKTNAAFTPMSSLTDLTAWQAQLYDVTELALSNATKAARYSTAIDTAEYYEVVFYTGSVPTGAIGSVGNTDVASLAASIQHIDAEIQALSAQLTAFGSGNVITVIAPVTNTGALYLTRGDDYNNVTLQQPVFKVALTPSLTSNIASITLNIKKSAAERDQATRYTTLLSQTHPAVSNDGSYQYLTYSLTSAQTNNLLVDTTGHLQVFEVVAKFVSPASQRTLITGPVVVAGTVRW